jgi:type II secretory pathway component PulC
MSIKMRTIGKARGAGAAALLLLAWPGWAEQSLSVSTLPLELVGVVVNAAAPARSVCCVRRTYPSPRVGLFSTGESLYDYAEIREIRRDGVVLQNKVTNGPELLVFSRDKPFVAPSPSPPPPAPVPTQADDGIKVTVAKETIAHYLTNLPELLDSAFAAPRYRDGQDGRRIVEGFEISRIKDGGAADQLGLKNGDVILDVNGEPLDGLPTVMRLLGQAQSLPQARLTVLRGGQKMSFVIDRK